MKKNIIISLVALSFSCAMWGQESKTADRRLNVEKTDQIKLIEKKEGKDQTHFSWSVINDTTNIKSEKAIYVGKIEHNSGKKVRNFVVIENNKDTIINEESTYSTDSVLTIKPGNVYDFYKAGKVPFLTIRVVSPIHPTYNFAILPTDRLKIGGDTLSMGIDRSFTYKLRPDTLLYINNWSKDYRLSLKGGILSSKVSNRLCCGDTVIVEKGGNKYMLLVEGDEKPIYGGIPTWVTCLLAVLTLLLLFGLYIVIRKRRTLQHSVELMSSDLAKAEAFWGQISEMLPIEKSEDENEQDLPAPQNSDETDSSEYQDSSKQQDSQNSGDDNQQEVSKSGNDKQKKNKTSFFKKIGLKLRKLFSTEVYKEKTFLTDQISNGIIVLNEEIQHNSEEIEKQKQVIESINLLVMTENKEEGERLKGELKEIGSKIWLLKKNRKNFDHILEVLNVDNYEAALKEIRELQELNDSDVESKVNMAVSNSVVNLTNPADENEDTTRWVEVKRFLESNQEKSKYYGGALEVAVLNLLKKFFNGNFFRDELRSKHEQTQATLNCYILEILGKQGKELFNDAEGNSKNWVTYLKEKFTGSRELSEEQKENIIDDVILDVSIKDVSESRVVDALMQQLLSLLRYDGDKKLLSNKNARIQTIADILNNIPRTDDEAKQKGAEEILTLLQGVLQSKEPVCRENIYSAVRQYFRISVIERIDEVLSLDAFKNKISEREEGAKAEGKEEILSTLQSTLEFISQKEGADVEGTLKKINVSDIKPAIEKVFENLHETRNEKELEEEKKILLENPLFEDVKADIVKYKSSSPLIRKLTKIVENSKEESVQLAGTCQNLKAELKTQKGQHEQALKDAEKAKQAALEAQKKELDAKIQEEKDGREYDKREWQVINNANISTIKEYHLAELVRIKNALVVIDGQLRSAYTNFDRSTPLGKLIDSFIRKNTFYSLDKFFDKIENIETDPTEPAPKLAESMRTLYKECLNLTPPTWIDVLTRLYCYTDVPFIAEEFEKANLDCQAIRHAFFQMENLLRDTGIIISYPRLFKDKLNENYEVKPERNIDNYVTGLAEHVNDRKAIIDLYTVGFQINNEEPRKPVVSTF